MEQFFTDTLYKKTFSELTQQRLELKEQEAKLVSCLHPKENTTQERRIEIGEELREIKLRKVMIDAFIQEGCYKDE